VEGPAGQGGHSVTLSRPAIVALDVVAWAVIHASTGYLVHRLPGPRFEGDGWLWRERRFERGGRLYVERFRIKRWKRWLPEAGALFPGGFDKGRLDAATADYLHTYVRETRRAELGHWLAMLPAPLFFFWNPPAVGLFMVVVYAPLANGPCILAQRYNRIRVMRVLRARHRRRPVP